MSFNLHKALRQLKPGRRMARPEPRPDEDIDWADEARPIEGQLLLDTTVYIDVLHGSVPEAVAKLITFRTCNHSAVCLAEMTHAFGRLDPQHPGTSRALKAIEQTIENDIPPHRIFTPGDDVWGAAGMLSGTVMRLFEIEKGSRNQFLNDALLYLHGAKLGCTVLTRNVRDFDIMNQLAPFGRVLFYRQAQ